MESKHFWPTLIATLVLCVPGSIATAGDWPQFLGPNRNGSASADESLFDAWPESGPKIAWQREVGSGFAGLAVADGVAILFHRIRGEEIVEALNATTGKPIWKKSHATTYSTAYTPDNGPRCIPIIHKNRVYVFGAQGVLRCLDLSNGRIIWTRMTHKDFGALEGYFGAGSTPIIDGDKILVNVGAGRAGAGIVAFSLDKGKVQWKATNELASYSSPVAATIDGSRHVIFVTRYKTISLNPRIGDIRFEFPFGARGPTVNGASPIVLGDHLFVSAHYGVGARLLMIDKNSATEIWRSDEIMSSQYMTCIENKGLLYGIDGQERASASVLKCFDPKTRKVHWSVENWGFGSMIQADGKFIGVTTTGELKLFRVNSSRYQELAKTQAFKRTTRAFPALSNGLLYVRDTRTLKCLQVGRQR